MPADPAGPRRAQNVHRQPSNLASKVIAAAGTRVAHSEPVAGSARNAALYRPPADAGSTWAIMRQ